MASVIDICNTALARIGDTANVSSIDPPEGSAQAQHCARFYPIALSTALEAHSWTFATKRARLAEKATDTWGWIYAYAAPSDSLRVSSVLPAGSKSDSNGEYFDTITDADGQTVILTNCTDASALYTAAVGDTTRFSPMFTDALTWLLASYIAGPIIKGTSGDEKSRNCLQVFNYTLSLAKTSDANQRRIEIVHTPAWLSER